MLIPTRHFSPFKLFLHPASQTALVLNPKVMTTFQSRFLAEGLRLHHGRQDPSHGRYPGLAYPRRFPVASLAELWGFLRDPARYQVFAFVRDPYARVASAWRNKFLDPHLAGDGRDGAYPRSVRQRHLAPLRRMARVQGLSGGQWGEIIPFATFLAYVASRPPGRRDHHWDLQTQVLMCDRLPYARLWRIEDQLHDGFQVLADRLGFAAPWVAAQLARPANPSRSQAPVYDGATAAQVRDLFAADFAAFGYDPGAWTGR